jgi:cytoskeleton protein RodZ
MASLSERLKRERELRGISLRQISEETRIGVRFLEALEEDRLDVIPGEFYRRSYLRSYARYLGLDEDRALNAYDFLQKEKHPEEDREEQQEVTTVPSWVKWAVAFLLVAGPAVLLLRAIPASTRESTPPTSAAPRMTTPPRETAPAPALEPQMPFPAEANPTPSGSSPVSSVPSVPDGTLHLVISTVESCWLEIEADGEVVITGLKDEGFRQEVVARREVRMWLGNAGGVKLLVNDHEAAPLGRPGQVRKDLTITPENFRDFVADRS